METPSLADYGYWNPNNPYTVRSTFNSFPSGKAEHIMSELYRREFEDYKKRFYPHEDKLIDFATNSQTVDDALQRTSASFDNAARLADSSFAQHKQRYGINETARQKINRERTTSLNNAAARVYGLNQTRRAVEDLQNQVLSGDMATGMHNEGRV